MTTLNVDDEELVRAVSGFPTVAAIAADATIPDKLTITVTERLPVATVSEGGETVAVSADGYLLPGVEVQDEGVPQIEGAEVSAGRLQGEARGPGSDRRDGPRRAARAGRCGRPGTRPGAGW